MTSKNYKVLEVKENQEYVFDSYEFKASVRRYVKGKKAKGEIITMEKVKAELADKTFASIDSITNWMYGRNGVSDIEVVKTIADYLEIGYDELLKEKEIQGMSENKEINTISNVNMDKTKDVIRSVYQKMARFMDMAEECVGFDESEEIFKENEPYYIDVKRTLHLSMLDIPEEIYKELETILDTFEIYMYGASDGFAYIWECSDYIEFLEEIGREDDIYSMKLYMQREAKRFYDNIRSVLKNYITV